MILVQNAAIIDLVLFYYHTTDICFDNDSPDRNRFGMVWHTLQMTMEIYLRTS